MQATRSPINEEEDKVLYSGCGSGHADGLGSHLAGTLDFSSIIKPCKFVTGALRLLASNMLTAHTLGY
jgi:hypothetical protein